MASAGGASAAAALGALTDRERLIIIAGLCSSVFMVGVSLGGIIPWIALKQDGIGTDEVTIGIIVAAQPLGIMLIAPLAYRIATSLGLARSMVLFSLASLPGLALLPFTDSNPLWILLRLSSGLATAVPWVLGETWINMATKPQWRARTTAIYGAAVAGGFALGPLVLTLFESQLDLAIAAFAVLSFIAVVPLLPILRYSPSIAPEKSPPFWSIIFAMPVVFFAVVLASVADITFAAFLPLWSTDQGLPVVLAMVLVSVLMVGNVILQFPIGMLADRIGLRQTMRLCGIVSLIAPVLIIVVGVNLVLLIPLLFVFGGAVWALYSLALADLGNRLTGSALAAANGAVVFVYTAASVVGPPIAGAGLKMWTPHGFILVAIGAALVFVVLAMLRPDPAKAAQSATDAL